MNKIVLITGASAGVGRSMAFHLAATFDHIILAARRIELLHEYFGEDPKYSLHQVDLAVLEQTIRFTDEVLATHGFVPYVINNAGMNFSAPVSEIEASNLQSSLNVNAISPLLIVKGLLPPMRESNFGRIVNVTSGAPLNCSPGTGSYAASKAALNTLTSVLASELENTNVKINLMSPGPVRTEMAPMGALSPEVCLPTLDFLLNVPEWGPNGRFFWLGHEVPLRPDVSAVDWQNGRPGPFLRPAF